MRKNLLLTGIALLAVGVMALPLTTLDEATRVSAEGSAVETIYGAWHDNSALAEEVGQGSGWWVPHTDAEFTAGGVTWVGSAVRYNNSQNTLEIMSEDSANGLEKTSITDRTDGSDFQKIGEAVLALGESAEHRYNAIYTKEYVHVDKNLNIALDGESGVYRIFVKFKDERPDQTHFVAGEWNVLKHQNGEAGMSMSGTSFNGTNTTGDWNAKLVSYAFGDGWGPGYFNYLAGYDVQIAIVHQSWSASSLYVKNVTLDTAQACEDLVQTWTATETNVCDALRTENSVLRNTLIETQYGLTAADQETLAATALTGTYGSEANVLAQLNYFNSVAGLSVSYRNALLNPLTTMNNSYVIIAVVGTIGCAIIVLALLKKKKAR